MYDFVTLGAVGKSHCGCCVRCCNVSTIFPEDLSLGLFRVIHRKVACKLSIDAYIQLLEEDGKMSLHDQHDS